MGDVVSDNDGSLSRNYFLTGMKMKYEPTLKRYRMYSGVVNLDAVRSDAAGKMEQTK